MGWLVDYAKDRIKANKNLLALFVGGTGSGKTYASLKYAELIDKRFNIGRVVFNTEDFMNLINSGLRSGSVVVYDEVGVGHSARSWHSMANRLFNYVLQTFRHRNIIVLFSTPDVSFIDKQARKLIHLIFETVSINRIDKLCKCKPFIVQNSPTYDKIYRKYPIVWRNGHFQTIKRVNFGLPSSELVEAYEVKKNEYTSKLNDEIISSIEADKVKVAKRQPFDPHDWLDKARELGKQLEAEGKKLTITNICAYLGLSRERGGRVHALL